MANNNVKFNIGIGYNVDESGLNKLQANLTQIINMGNQASLKGLTTSEKDAIQKASVLKDALQKAYNADLGATNISKLNTELRKSGSSINACRTAFKNLGAQGAAAYNLLGTQILGTNVKIKETNKWLDRMATTFANTFRYNISANIFNNITGAIQKSVRYVEDLDESLNAIRIVSGQSANNMQNFAEYANEAAKSLGATTLDYTDASLIYYQQGLGEEEVKARTNVTLEMANVLGQSASQVSDYMTAIWNNFDDGSKSLEYYGDVITALGASTASSAAEISEGLEKFAAIADTVGLSYEYATTALATVVAETRQSADIVGTSFKTLFARIQDLELGETLDDGTTLGKYSQALNAVGINIKDQSGQLKDMNDILDEMGSKWQTLSKDEQVALAQTVAGTRQYTQLVALMDNWDTFGENLKTASNATGTLQKQQDIYLQSTEAHLNKLKVSAEGLYSTLIDKNDINSVVDALTNFVTILDQMFSSFGGGMKSIAGIGAILSQLFNKQIANAAISLVNNFRDATNNADLLKAKIEQIKSGTTVDSNSIFGKRTQADYEAQLPYAEKIVELQKEGLLTQEQSINLTEQQNTIGRLAAEEEMYNHIIETTQKAANLEADDAKKLVEQETKGQEQILDKYRQRLELIEQINKTSMHTQTSNQDQYAMLSRKKDLATKVSTNLINKQNNGIILSSSEEEKLKKCKLILAQIEETETAIGKTVKEASKSREAANKATKAGLDTTKEQVAQSEKLVELEEKRRETKSKRSLESSDLDTTLEDIEKNKQISSSITAITGGLGALAMGWMSVNSAIDTYQSYQEGNISFMQMLSSEILNLTMALPMVTSGLKQMFTGFSSIESILSTLTSATYSYNAAEAMLLTTKFHLKGVNKAFIDSAMQEIILRKKNGEEITKETIAQVLLDEATQAGNVSLTKENAEKMAEIVLDNGIITTNEALIVTKIKETLARFANIAAIDAEKMSLGQLAIAAIAANAAVLIVVGVIATATSVMLIAHKKTQKAREDEIESLNKQIDKHKENAQSLEEEAKSMDELSSKYDDIISKRNELTISESDAREQVYQLCSQYGLESEALQALIGDYTNLNTAIKKVQSEKSKKAAEERKKIYEKEAEKAQYEVAKDNQKWYNNYYGKKLDEVTLYETGSALGDSALQWAGTGIGTALGGLVGLGAVGAIAGNKTAKWLSSQDKKDNAFTNTNLMEGLISEDGKSLDVSKLLMKAAEDDDFYDRVKAYAEAGSEKAEQVLTILQDNDETISSISENLDAYKDNMKEAIISEKSIDVTDLKSYVDQVQAAADEAITEGIFKEGQEADALQWAKTAMMAIDDVQKYAAQAELVFNIKEKSDNSDSDEIIKWLTSGDLSKEAIQYLTTKVKYSESSDISKETLNKMFTEGESEINFRISVNATNDTKTVLENFYKNGSFSKDDQQQLLSDDSFKDYLDKLDIAENEFSAMCKYNSEEAATLVEGYLQNTSDAVIDKSKEELKQYKQELADIQKEKVNDNDNTIVGIDENGQQEIFNELSIDDAVTQAQIEYNQLLDYVEQNPISVDFEGDEVGALEITASQISEIIDKLKNGVKLTDEEKTIFKVLQESVPLYEPNIKRWGDVEKAAQQYNERLSETQNLIDSTENAIDTLSSSIQRYAHQVEITNKAIDGMQNAYKEFKNAQDEYASNGHLSVDTLQSLLALDTKYFEAIDVTNNGLEIRKEKVLEVVKAELAQLAAEEALAALKAVEAFTNSEKDSQERADALEVMAAATLSASDATMTLAESRLADARAALAESNATEEDRKTIEKYLDSVEKKIKLTGNNINKLTIDDVMPSSKSSSKKDKEHMKEVIDVYHQYERQLKACKAAQDELTERQSHLKGKQLLKNLNAQNEALKQQVEIQQALNAEYAKQAQLLQSKLSSQGATFDGNGEISNYQALLEQAQAKYNAAVDAYNKNKTDANEKAIDNAKQEYDNLKSMISEYEKAVEGLQSAQKAMNELMQKQADVALAKLETEWEIEFQIDTHKAQRKLEDFINTLNDDFRKSFKDWEKEFKNASDKFFYSGLQEDIINQIKEIEDIEKFMDDTKQRANEEFRTYVIDNFMEGYDPTKEGEYTFQEGDIFTSASDASEYLLKLGDQLEELAGQLKEAYETAWEAYLEGIDQAIEETERLNNIIDKNINKLEQYRKIQTLALNGGESTSNTLEYNQTLNKQYDAQIKAFTTQKSKLEGYLATTGITLKKDATGAIDESAVNVLAMDEDQKKIYDQILTYQDQILDTTVKRVETEKEILNLQAQQTLEKTATDLFGSSDVDYLKQQWEDALKWEERYYDGNEKIYQLEQLGKKYDDLKTKNMSLKAQQKINEAKQKELDELSQSVNLSKDELALAEKRLEVTQAEIALEEAQNNKNTMKLTRDESGNWTYQYVANEDDVESKQQDLIDKSYEYYELAKEAYENGVEYAFNIWETYKEKITDLINDQSISDEERSLRLQELTNQTKTYIESCATDTSKFMVDLNTSEAVLLKNTLDSGQIGMDTLSEAQKALVQATNDANVQDLQQTRDEMKDVNSQLSESARDTLTQDTEFFATKASEAVGVWKSKEAEITISITNASNTVQTKISEYQGKINEYARIIGLDLTNVSKSYQGITDSTEKATNAANNYISSQMAKLLGVKAEIDKIKAAWDIVAAACTNAANSMQSYIKQTQAAVRAAESLASATAKATAEVEKLNAAQSKSSSTGGDKTRINATTIAAGQVYTLGSKTIGRQDQNGKYYVTGSDKALTRSQFEDKMKRLGYTLGSLGTFDTGGYTGSWTNGSQENNGRLAFLHQKELVLNESDTSNMLEMVNIVRNMQSASGAIDKAILGGIANMISAVTGVKVQDINNTTNSSNNNTANTFNITAEFPNANDVNDIREAILSLPNLAQQYISMNTL